MDIEFPRITRVEIIGPHGREFTNTAVQDVEIDLQDNGRTLKLFYRDEYPDLAVVSA